MTKKDKEIDNKLIGVCGLFCGACDNYLAFTSGNEHLLQNGKFQNRKDQYCEGCNSGRVSAHCSKCEIRLCAINKEITSCADCSDFPCNKVINFKEDGEKWDGAKHRKDILENVEEYKIYGSRMWLEKQVDKWTCKCGKRYSFYEMECNFCGNKLVSYANITKT